MKYFVVSDIHSFYRELVSNLRMAGFNKRNKDHTLIVIGDIFDRGPDTLKVYKFLKSIPKKRRIMIKGNHEELYLDLLKKSLPDSYDYSNHTVDTFCHIAGYSPEIMKPEYWYRLQEESPYERLCQAWDEIRKSVAESEITAWLRSDEWIDWFELDRFIFTHSFIPLHNVDGLPGYYIDNRRFEYFPTWRTEATQLELSDSRWGCPWKNYMYGYFDEEEKAGKTLVCGHWVVTDFKAHINGDILTNDTEIFYSRGLIALDCGVWKYRGSSNYYHPQNVLVIENGICYDKYGKELKEDTIIQTIPASEVK